MMFPVVSLPYFNCSLIFPSHYPIITTLYAFVAGAVANVNVAVVVEVATTSQSTNSFVDTSRILQIISCVPRLCVTVIAVDDPLPISTEYLAGAPISANVHDTAAEPSTDFPVLPIVTVRAVPQLVVVIFAEPLIQQSNRMLANVLLLLPSHGVWGDH